MVKIACVECISALFCILHLIKHKGSKPTILKPNNIVNTALLHACASHLGRILRAPHNSSHNMYYVKLDSLAQCLSNTTPDSQGLVT